MSITADELPPYPASGGGTRIKLNNEAGDLRRRNDSLTFALEDAAEAVAGHLDAAEKAAAAARRITAAAKSARGRR